MDYEIKKDSAAYPLLFLMIDSTDHISGKPSLAPTVTLSKNGAPFAAPAGAVSEIGGAGNGNGWYKVAGHATDTNGLGPLVLHASAAGADPMDALYEVVAHDPQDATGAELTALATAAGQLAILTKLNAATITAISPVLADGSVEIVAGDSYYDVDGRALAWNQVNYSGPAVSGLTVTLKLMVATDYRSGGTAAPVVLTAAGTAAMASTTAVFKIELSASQTAALEATTPPASQGGYVYQLMVTVTATGHVLTEAIGSLTCDRAVGP